jgi:hypothetical protein
MSPVGHEPDLPTVLRNVRHWMNSGKHVLALSCAHPFGIIFIAELAPLMAQRGNVSTMVADYGASGMSLYGSSKKSPAQGRAFLHWRLS